MSFVNFLWLSVLIFSHLEVDFFFLLSPLFFGHFYLHRTGTFSAGQVKRGQVIFPRGQVTFVKASLKLVD